MKNLKYYLLLAITALYVLPAFSQQEVSGTVTDKASGTPIPGVTVGIKETTKSTFTDADGKYKIVMPEGKSVLLFSYIGMKTQEVNVSGGSVDVSMEAEEVGLNEIYVVADRAKERETPVAFSNVDKTVIQQQLGSRDIPLVMNTTPSVYSTQQGGGAGDARISVRGFNQQNVAIMINGVPVNDMENGWVYWSNWDGLADATSSIQMQRGLSAVNLATPSIGGTMNIITSPAEHEAGGSAKFEYGSGNFFKTTLSGNSGLIANKFAVSAGLVRKIGDGVVNGTWTDAWAYYLGTSYKINKSHKVELFAIGAPQRHGQNSYRQNVAAYSHDYAAELGAVQETLDAFPESSDGQLYNENVSNITVDYQGKQYWNGKQHDRFATDFINERENYYHKPLVNLNWYANWAPKINQYTTVYYSGGTGGGSGTYGSMRWDYDSQPSRIVDWDATYERNTATDTARGILRNSVNNQTTWGALSKFRFLLTDNLKAQVGVDWRTATIEHFREVRDLLGGQFFYHTNNEFESGTDYNKVLGDKIDYNFTNTVDWIGYFAQMEYSSKFITAYGTFGHSFIGYTYTNHFKKDDNGNELYAETDKMPGFQLKGGLSYRPMTGLSVFANYGYVSKSPIFDNVIDDVSGTIAADPQNEIFNAFEAGVDYSSINKMFDIKLNYYYTSWTDRAQNIAVINQDGSEGFYFIQGMDQLHKGFEAQIDVRPIDVLTFTAFASFGDWSFTSDVTGSYKDYSSGSETTEVYNYYVNGLKVGDAPQTQIGGVIALYPFKGFRFQADVRHYSNHFADWDPFSRTDETDKAQVWETPAYMLVDLHASYKLPLKGKVGVEVFGHVFNLFDEMYVQDALDNSHYNGYYGINDEYSHTVNSAEVFLGLPRNFNFGVNFTF